MTKVAFVFTHSPFDMSFSREGLDALLATSAFCEPDELAVFFVQDGVLNLVNNQSPNLIGYKDFLKTFKLLDLYEIEQRYVCKNSLDLFHLDAQKLIIQAAICETEILFDRLRQATHILTF